jgi:hypothetical protein
MRPASGLVEPLAVRVLSRTRAHAPLSTATIPAFVLALTLVAPAVDLLRMVQPSLPLASLGVIASGAACGAVLVMWLRFPRTSWLAAASLAAVASFAMRLVGADVAELLSLLAVVALGIGGAFAPTAELADHRAAVRAPDLLGRTTA